MVEIIDSEFDNTLMKLIKRDASVIITIPGIYEILSEFYNNEIIDIIENEKEVDE